MLPEFEIMDLNNRERPLNLKPLLRDIL